MITAGTDLSFSIRQVNNRLTVAVMPRRTGLKGEAGGQIVPLVLNGTPEELDAEFLQAISTPVQKAQGILTNLETFEKQAEQAASQNKGAKSPLEKEPKEVREKREKMEKLLKKADEAIAGKRYSEALTWLRQAKVLATPDRQKDIDAKMAEVQKKASEGSLFGEEPFMQASQPQQEAQPLRRQDGQALIFEPEPAAAMPQNVPQQQPPQPVQYTQPAPSVQYGADGRPAYSHPYAEQRGQIPPGQPVQASQTMPQAIQFHQPVHMPQQPVYGGQWPQPVQYAQPAPSVQYGTNGRPAYPHPYAEQRGQMPPGQPVQASQPMPQPIQFHQPVHMPQQPVYGGQWQQPVPAQPQNVSVQAAPGNNGNREYRSQPQPAEMYSFDKDDECDRELLREDPYAEYLDFPEEYRMKDEAQMETVCC